MILTQLRDYVKSRGRPSSSDIAVRFDLSVDTVDQMLGHLLEPRGRIRRLSGASCSACGGCSGCSSAQAPTVYEWIGNPDSATL